MTITLKFFASCAEEVGKRAVEVVYQETPLKVFKAAVGKKRLTGRDHLRVAVNRQWAEWDSALNDGDEVAILPPVSGG